MKILPVLIILTLSINVFAQKPEECSCKKNDKTAIKKYFAELDEQTKFIVECEQQMKDSNRKPIAARCEWGSNGCPLKLAKPEFPSNAKKLNISGIVSVEIIVDENGAVIYAKMIEGNKIFKKSSERAACKSEFTPFRFCGKTVKYRTIIKFSFVK